MMVCLTDDDTNYGQGQSLRENSMSKSFLQWYRAQLLLAIRYAKGRNDDEANRVLAIACRRFNQMLDKANIANCY